MSGYIGTQPVPQATQTRQTFTAAAGQTSFATAGYTPNYLDVWLNGVKLVNGTDFTATNGSDVVLTSGAADGDTLEVLAFTSFEVLNQNFTGGVTVDNDGATVLTVDRATSDGTIVDFQKDGASVGGIGTKLGYLTVGTGVSGVLFNDDFDRMHPWNLNTNSSSDGTMDLGAPTERWDNLYLSSGVYFGGTGAANKLDDYEEGTWTPTFSSGSFGGSSNFTYTKIGRTVHITGFLANPSGLPSGDILVIGGLPFAGNADYQMSLLWYNGSSSVIAAAYVVGGGSSLNVRPIGGYPSSFTELSVQMTYITNA